MQMSIQTSKAQDEVNSLQSLAYPVCSPIAALETWPGAQEEHVAYLRELQANCHSSHQAQAGRSTCNWCWLTGGHVLQGGSPTACKG